MWITPATPALAIGSSTPQSDSLLKELLPVAPDKVPNQRLPGRIVGNVDDGGGGILPPDVLRIQSVTQVPAAGGKGRDHLRTVGP